MVLIDWQLASAQPPAVDLAWLLQSFALVVTASKEEIIAEYREQLAARLGARFDESTWEQQLQLGCLGQCVRTTGMWLSALRPNRHRPRHATRPVTVVVRPGPSRPQTTLRRNCYASK